MFGREPLPEVHFVKDMMLEFVNSGVRTSIINITAGLALLATDAVYDVANLKGMMREGALRIIK